MIECSICFDSKEKKNFVDCSKCQFSACVSCWKKFMMEKEQSCCMNVDCKNEFQRKFIFDHFDMEWITSSWEMMKRKQYITIENSLLPMTQYRMKNTDCFDINKSPFFRKCLEKDCRGYLDDNWICGICSTKICSKCLSNTETTTTTTNTEHICSDEMVATVSSLKENTKPCPKCFTPIYKIEGCDQMWCTQCHYAFHWKDGSLQRNFHNPHFVEYKRRNNKFLSRDSNDVECDRSLEDTRLLDSLYEKSAQKKRTRNTTNCICRIEGTNLFVSGTKGYLELWEFTNTGDIKKKEQFFIKDEWICGMCSIPGTKEFIFCLREEIQIWTYEKNTIVQKQVLLNIAVEGFLSSVCYLPKFKLLLSGGRSHFIYCWKRNKEGRFFYSGKEKKHTAHIYYITHIPNTNIIMSGGRDNNIVMWKWQEEKLCHYQTMETEHESIRGIYKLPNSNRLVTTCHRYVKVWEHSDDFEVMELQQNFPCYTMFFMNIENTNIFLSVGNKKNSIVFWSSDEYGNFEKILNITDNDTNFYALYIPEINKIVVGNNNFKMFTWEFDFSSLYSIEKISNIIRQTKHLKDVESIPYHYTHVDNEPLRKSFLENKIEKDVFEEKLYKEYLQQEENEEIRLILDLQIQGITDIIYRLCMNNDKFIDEYLVEIKTLTEYCNQLLKENADLYYSLPLKIDYSELDETVLTRS